MDGALPRLQMHRVRRPSAGRGVSRWREVGEASQLHLELVTGAAHHAVSAQLTAERCDLDSIRTRIDNLIAH